MIIKYIKNKEIERGGYTFIEITGEKDDGSIYTRDFPSWEDKLVSQLEEFAEGEFLELSYNKDKYKNINNIKGASGFPGKKTNAHIKSQPKSSGGTMGITRGDDTNRASAIYLAKDIVLAQLAGEFGPLDNTLNILFQTADKVLKYISEGRNVVNEDAVKKQLTVADVGEGDK